jgi:hypothetical protein
LFCNLKFFSADNIECFKDMFWLKSLWLHIICSRGPTAGSEVGKALWNRPEINHWNRNYGGVCLLTFVHSGPDDFFKTWNCGTCYSQNTNGLFVTLVSLPSCRCSSYRLLLRKDYTFPNACLISWFWALTSVQFSTRISYPAAAQSSMINPDHDSNQFPTSLFCLGNNIDSVDQFVRYLDQFVQFYLFSTPNAAGFRGSRFLIKFCSGLV